MCVEVVGYVSHYYVQLELIVELANNPLHILPLLIREVNLMALVYDEGTATNLLSDDPILCLKMPFGLLLHFTEETTLINILPSAPPLTL